jgi:hypothetical protein
MKRTAAGLALLATFLIAPAVAHADSGKIAEVHANPDGTVQATYTTTSTTCDPDGFCGWYPHARQVPADQPCGDWQVDHLTYVGDVKDDPGTQAGSDFFYPLATSVRICLYINAADGTEPLVAEYVYNPAAPGGSAPPPTPATLSLSAARKALPGLLAHRYHGKFAHRKHFKRNCSQLALDKVRCTVRWDWQRFRYAGKVTLRNTAGATTLSKVSIHRKRRHA